MTVRLSLRMIMVVVLGTSQVQADTCLSCHRDRDALLTTAWENSRHATAGVGCEACHGSVHDGGMATQARRPSTCTTGCHQQEQSSHALSKHGVIATLEANRADFSLPLKEGNQRAPSCAYCHLYDREHDAGSGIPPLTPTGHTPPPDASKRIEARARPCLDCHSPRFVKTWFASGDQMVEIGRMKVREAEAVASRFDSPAVQTILQRMQAVHWRNIRLGVGHASPDDQWWHGHPALDGDLLRIKSLAGRMQPE